VVHEDVLGAAGKE